MSQFKGVTIYKNEGVFSFNLGLNPDGSERVDTSVLVKNLGPRPISADEKLKIMLQREMDKFALRKGLDEGETNLDDHDFELPEEPDFVHRDVNTSPVSKRELVRYAREQKRKQESKTDGEDSAVRKSAKTDRAKPVENDNSDKSAAKGPREAADDTEE